MILQLTLQPKSSFFFSASENIVCEPALLLLEIPVALLKYGWMTTSSITMQQDHQPKESLMESELFYSCTTPYASAVHSLYTVCLIVFN